MSCNEFEKVVIPDIGKSADTIYFTPIFTSTGPCTVFVSAPFSDDSDKTAADTLSFYIFPAQPGIAFITIPPLLSTHSGKTDTLLFVTKTSGGAGIPAYAVSSTPVLDNPQLFVLSSALKDTARVIFTPASAGAYTLFISATAPVAGAVSVNATASVELRVADNIMPSIIDVPQTVLTGTVDTIIFSINNSHRSDKLTMKLVTEQPLDPEVFSVLPTGIDSILIRVSPTVTVSNETVKIGVITSNGVISDTSWYPITFINQASALWNTNEIALTAIEGKPMLFDLRPYFIKQQTGAITFNADLGTIVDTAWKWTPAYGTNASATASITATKDTTTASGLKLVITVSPGDTTKPTLALADQTIDGKRVSSPQITIECIAGDDESGIDMVAATYGAKIVEATLQHDNVYSGVVAGLTSGVPTPITITATDRSMKKNSRAITFTVTYDSTMLDAEPPALRYVGGPKNGDRVKIASGTVTYSISDNSGVDSVWWTLNGSPGGSITKSADNNYTFNYLLTSYGSTTIVIHAQDASKNRNHQTAQVTFDYNTFPTAVTATAPQNDAIDVAVTPSFSWTGGSDVDGDTVYFSVYYGTAQNSLSSRYSETSDHGFTITPENRFVANTTYYWKVKGYTKKPYTDTVESATTSFKTTGSAPTITTPLPSNVQVIEGATLTLKIDASGIPAPSYRWYKNTTELQGQTASEYNKTNVTAGDAGTYYVVVSNGIGSAVTSTNAIVTIRLKATITQDPASITANEGGNASFTVQAAGETPLYYQWLRDGQAITGETAPTYTLANATPTDSGRKFSCMVNNSFSRDTSASVLLTVTPTPKYTVSFNVDGGSSIPSQQIRSGQTATKPATDPVKDGFEFGGWYTSNSFATAFNFTTQTITADCFVYAKWIPVYTVTYDRNSGSGSVPTDSRKYKSGENATILGNTGNLTRGGFVFSGWNTNSAGTGTQFDPGSGLPVTGPVLLYARWKRLCSVTFDGDGATTSPSPASASVADGATVGTLPTGQAKTGYEFDSWWTGRKGTGTQVAATTVVNGDIVAYAKWIIRDIDNNTYTDVTIGSQTWMVENLKVTRYRDGTDAPYNVYENDNSNKDSYGLLYNWRVVDPANTVKIAPAGWHVPSDAEWTMLQNYLIANGYNYDGTTSGNKIGRAMASTSGWKGNNTVGTVGFEQTSNNRSFFSGSPGGYYFNFNTSESFGGKGEGSYWLASDDYGSAEPKTIYSISYDSEALTRNTMPIYYAVSIRLVRDY